MAIAFLIMRPKANKGGYQRWAKDIRVDLAWTRERHTL